MLSVTNLSSLSACIRFNQRHILETLHQIGLLSYLVSFRLFRSFESPFSFFIDNNRIEQNKSDAAYDAESAKLKIGKT